MKNAIILSGNEKVASAIGDILKEVSIEDTKTYSHASAVRGEIDYGEGNLYIINTPLVDESGVDISIEIARKQAAEVILIVKEELIPSIEKLVVQHGVFLVSKPIQKPMLFNALKMALSAHSRMKRMQVEHERLLAEIEDMKVINRAKCLLISCLRMTEDEAHRYIERQAMDMRITKRGVAEGVLRTYDN